MRILIIGAGAIGTMLGVMLSNAGADVTFLDMPEVLKSISSRGMSLKVNGAANVIRVVKSVDYDHLSKGVTYDVAVLCVKSYHTENMMNTLSGSLFHSILTIQNGVGNEELLAERFGEARILSGIITLPVAVHGPGAVEITNSKGGIGLSSLQENARLMDLKRLLGSAGFDARLYKSYREMKWSKLMLNIVGNASSAILGIPPQEIFNNRKLTKLEKLAFVEGLNVVREQGLKLVDLPGYPVRLIGFAFRNLPPTMLELIMSAKTSSSRGGKMPSLYIDISSGSQYSEVEALNGAIVRHAGKLGLQAPVNRLFCDTLMGMVRGELPRDLFKNRPLELWEMYRNRESEFGIRNSAGKDSLRN